MKKLILIYCALLPLASSMAQGQSTAVPPLKVFGEVETSLNLTITDLIAMNTVTLEAKDNHGTDHRYKGVPLFDILQKAGTTLGTQLRGKNLVKFVLVTAADGYEVLFSLPEIDTMFTKQTVLLAYEMDNAPLGPGVGPYRLVVPNDQRHARWIREIRSIEVVFAP